jgi:hypothetical protein
MHGLGWHRIGMDTSRHLDYLEQRAMKGTIMPDSALCKSATATSASIRERIRM